MFEIKPYSGLDTSQTIKRMDSALSVFLFGSQNQTTEGMPLTNGSKHVKISNCLNKGHEVCETKLLWLLLHMRVVFMSVCVYMQFMQSYIIL